MSQKIAAGDTERCLEKVKVSAAGVFSGIRKGRHENEKTQSDERGYGNN
jgi:hypothetical protein